MELAPTIYAWRLVGVAQWVLLMSRHYQLPSAQQHKLSRIRVKGDVCLASQTSCIPVAFVLGPSCPLGMDGNAMEAVFLAVFN